MNEADDSVEGCMATLAGFTGTVAAPGSVAAGFRATVTKFSGKTGAVEETSKGPAMVSSPGP